jgi:hypothetical protein
MGINGKTRIKLAERANWSCCWCGQKTRAELGWQNSATIEHVTPVSLGGTNKLENLTHACYRCNRTRGTQNAAKFKVLAEAFDADTRLITQAARQDREHARKIRREQLKQLAACDQVCYDKVPDPELNSRERYRKDRTLVKQALKQGRVNPFDAGTRCHRMFDVELAKLPVCESVWSLMWNKLTAWYHTLYSSSIKRENRSENCIRQQ